MIGAPTPTVQAPPPAKSPICVRTLSLRSPLPKPRVAKPTNATKIDTPATTLPRCTQLSSLPAPVFEHSLGQFPPYGPLDPRGSITTAAAITAA